MSRLLTPRNAIIFTVSTGGVYILAKRFGGQQTPMHTPAVQAIGDRWSSGGGSDIHTPGVATPRGNYEHTMEDQKDPKGIRSKHFQEGHADQKTDTPGAMGKMWYKHSYGPEGEKGK